MPLIRCVLFLITDGQYTCINIPLGVYCNAVFSLTASYDGGGCTSLKQNATYR